MESLEFTVWGHAGVRLEREGGSLAVDPGGFTDPQILAGVSAVLVTHEHADHVQPEKMARALADTSGFHLWAPRGVVEALEDAGASAERVHVASPGEDFEAAGFRVRVLGGEHAVIHPNLPRVANLAYLIEESVLHPGDSFPELPAGVAVDVLALPVSAPWMKIAEAVDFAAAVSPRVVVPIHDAILSDEGKAIVDRLVPNLIGEASYRRLAPGEALAVSR
ncbi:MBL fold metallo-hydrolase [Brevibacterium daeguense]|uniref:MBL fold metallo-hydrolase n=1 Tax=Brevibacterium daeguense TaxID=909936 RepID=A0ABP8EKE0_9MICO|nr:MBL fold metallo-hydrolase [Brevibacterium daeguense]